jgi:hypothetical protein
VGSVIVKKNKNKKRKKEKRKSGLNNAYYVGKIQYL